MATARRACWSASAAPAGAPASWKKKSSRNGWLTVPADPAIIFDLPVEERFNAALRLLGIDPIMLTAEAGHA